MELQIDNKQKIEFVLQEKEYEWYSSINILNKKFEFYFKNQEHINWEEIRKRIIYFIKYNDAIFEVALKGAIDYQKWLGYNLKYDKNFWESIELPISYENDDLFILSYYYERGWAEWEIHIYDDNGPKLRKPTYKSL
jgi:hypothetical protein